MTRRVTWALALVALAGAARVVGASPAEDLAAAQRELTTKQEALERARSAIEEAERLKAISEADLARLKQRQQLYTSKVERPLAAYQDSFVAFASEYRRSLWDPLNLDPDGQLRVMLAVVHASTLQRKDESFWQCWRRRAESGTYGIYRSLWATMGWRVNDLDALGEKLMSAELNLRTTRQDVDAQVARDPGIRGHGGGMVDSLAELHAAVSREQAGFDRLVAGLDERRGERDALVTDIDALVRRISRLEDEAALGPGSGDRAAVTPPPPSPPSSVAPASPEPVVVPKVSLAVDPQSIQAAEVTGDDGLRRRTYRFFVKATLHSSARAWVLLVSRSTEPALPHITSTTSYRPHARTSYSIRPGDREVLGGWEPGDFLDQISPMLGGFGPRVGPREKDLGPEYLTTDERGKFWGTYTALYDVLDATGRVADRVKVRWEPFPRPADEPPSGALRIVLGTYRVDPARGRDVCNIGGNDAIAGQDLVVIEAQGLPPGIHRMLVTIPRRGAFQLFGRSQLGRPWTRFRGWLPMPAGRIALSVRFPDLPGAGARALELPTYDAGAATHRQFIVDAPRLFQGFRANIDQARDRINRVRYTLELARAMTVLAESHLDLEEFGPAGEWLERSVALVESTRSIRTGYFWLNLARPLMRAGDLAFCRRDPRALVRHAELLVACETEHAAQPATGGPGRLVVAAKHAALTAERLLLMGEEASARAWLTRAEELYRRGGAKPDLASTVGFNVGLRFVTVP